MRWDRLFDELEQQSWDEQLAERDQLADELRDEAWAGTSWRDLLGGEVTLDVLGAGRVTATVQLAGDTVVHLRRGQQELLVAAAAVMAVLESQRRAAPASQVSRRLGWGPALRAARDEGVEVRAVRRDGVEHRGHVSVVGRDFAQLVGAGQSRGVTICWDALALLSLSR